MPPKRKSKREEDESEEEEPEIEDDDDEDDDGDVSPSPAPVLSRSNSNRPKRQAQEKVAVAYEEESKWTAHDSLLILNPPGLPPVTKLASFDMDDTIIRPKSSAKFPKSRSDWKWLFPVVPEKLKKLSDDGYAVVIFTNQAGIGKGHVKASDIKGKILDLSKELGIVLRAVIASEDDSYRKPATAMYKYWVQHLNGGVKPDPSVSFYVGDAAGRAANWKQGCKKDFSCSDRKFAHNIGLPFHTPDEFFLGEQAAPFEWGTIDPKAVLSAPPPAFTVTPSPTQEIVLFVGLPASGKSTFARRHFVPHGYVHVNQDTLKTKEKCFKAASEAVAAGKSVVIDNTNPEPATRAMYMGLAKEKNLPIRCFHFQTPEELTHHLNLYREKVHGVPHVPGVAYNICKKKMVEPSVVEGFGEIIKVPFVPQFDNPEHQAAFLEWTEKHS